MSEVAQLDVRTALKEGVSRLRAARVASHTLAAELLLMHALGSNRAWLYAHPEAAVEPAAAERYFQLVAQRAAGTPTQHLTGRQEFWGLEFEVTPDVLIPRPETEHVVEVALERAARRWAQPGARDIFRGEGWRVVDVGTGSGCLAVALARELPEATIFATDVSPAALAVAARNAARHGVAERVRFVAGNLLEPFLAVTHTPFHLVVSNPPYVATTEADQLPREVREHEPHTALFSGEQGAEIYEPLIRQAASLLPSGGILVLELGYGAAKRVHSLLAPQEWTNISVTPDLAGIPRVLAAERA